MTIPQKIIFSALSFAVLLLPTLAFADGITVNTVQNGNTLFIQTTAPNWRTCQGATSIDSGGVDTYISGDNALYTPYIGQALTVENNDEEGVACDGSSIVATVTLTSGLVWTGVLPLGGATFTYSNALTSVTGVVSDLGSYLLGVIPAILVILVSLLALGMGIRYVRKHISGRKF